MDTQAYAYKPDYAVPPGWVLADHLAAQCMSEDELARQCGCSPKLISHIIAGTAAVEPYIALQFERVLGLDADIWTAMERDYRIHKARKRKQLAHMKQQCGSSEDSVRDLKQVL